MVHKLIVECGGTDGTLKTHKVNADGNLPFDKIMRQIESLLEPRGYVANLRIDREYIAASGATPRRPENLRKVVGANHTYTYEEIG